MCCWEAIRFAVESATTIATTTCLGMHAACFKAVIVRAADGNVKKFEEL